MPSTHRNHEFHHSFGLKTILDDPFLNTLWYFGMQSCRKTSSLPNTLVLLPMFILIRNAKKLTKVLNFFLFDMDWYGLFGISNSASPTFFFTNTWMLRSVNSLIFQAQQLAPAEHRRPALGSQPDPGGGRVFRRFFQRQQPEKSTFPSLGDGPKNTKRTWCWYIIYCLMTWK